MIVPENMPGCAENSFMAVSESIVNMPWKAWTSGSKICGKALRMTWEMSKDAMMCESVSMG